jgi:hypothetical protein
MLGFDAEHIIPLSEQSNIFIDKSLLIRNFNIIDVGEAKEVAAQ